jgi:hypothetical protein
MIKIIAQICAPEYNQDFEDMIYWTNNDFNGERPLTMGEDRYIGRTTTLTVKDC